MATEPRARRGALARERARTEAQLGDPTERPRGGPIGTLLLLALALGCQRAPEHAASSSTLALVDGSLFVTSPDDDAVVELDPASLAVRRRVQVEGAPEGIAAVDGALVITLAQSTELAWIEGELVRRTPIPCGGAGAVVADGRGGAFVACPHDDRVLLVRLDGAVELTIHAPGRPTALAIADDRLAISASQHGRVRVHDVRDGRLLEEHTLEATPGHAAVSVDGLALDARGLHAVFQRVDHDSDRARPPERGGYGAVLDGAPRIEPRLLSSCGSRYARFDGGARVASGPSALATARGGSILWIAHRQTDNVLALRCDGGAPMGRLATFVVGRGPRGIIVTDDGRTAFVDLGFAHAVARLELPSGDAAEGPVLEAALERTRALGPTTLSDAALRGRSLFFDANDTHLTPSGVVTCGTCHPSGGEDGLTWFLHTRGTAPKLRRTPPAWGARAMLAPHHWDGELADAAALAQTTIRELMEGDALLVDTGAIAAWMDEAPIPPGRPLEPHEAPLAARGRALFDSDEVGCAGCHAGPMASDARAHEVLEPALDPLADLPLAHTPTLRNVRARPPYLHDGRAPTLESVLTDHNPRDRHGRTSQLSRADLEALLVYLETL